MFLRICLAGTSSCQVYICLDFVHLVQLYMKLYFLHFQFGVLKLYMCKMYDVLCIHCYKISIFVPYDDYC